MSYRGFTQQQVQDLASLANISLTDAEAESYGKQLEQIVAHIDQLKNLDTKGISPTTHATENMNVFFEDGAPPERQLKNLDGLDIKKINGQNYFVVKKIL